MGDLNRDGRPDLIVSNLNEGTVSVFLGIGGGNFGQGRQYVAGRHPGAVMVVDLDGDGRPDVLVSNESEGIVSVLYGGGDGTLQSVRSYPAGLDPALLTLGDFNGDGKTDVAVAGRLGKSVAILSNDGSGGLRKPLLYSCAKTIAALTAADLNGDERLDLALANSDGTISILVGGGDGSFSYGRAIAAHAGSPSSIASGDFDRDGKMDLALTDATSGQVFVFLGEGDGNFSIPRAYRLGQNPVALLISDINSDGHQDVISLNKNGDTFSVLLGNGDGSFQEAIHYVAGDGPLAAAVGDVYGNGHVDLVIANEASHTIAMPRGNGDGTFQAAREYSTGIRPRGIASGDLNGDKKTDLVVTNYCGSDSACGGKGNVAVFLGEDGGGYGLASTYEVGAGPTAVALVDVNQDKNLDIVALSRIDKTVSVLLGEGDGKFQQAMAFPQSDTPIAFAVGDFNRDGKPDLAVVSDCGLVKCPQTGRVDILLGAGDGSFSIATSYRVGYSPVSIAVGDLRGAGVLDLVVGNACGKSADCQGAGTATVLLADGKGGFTVKPEFSVGNRPTSIALQDLQGKGLPNLIVTRSADSGIAIMRGNGDGSFASPTIFKTGAAPSAVVAADFNGDGKLDLAVANAGDSTVSVLYGDDGGGLRATETYAVGAGPEALAAVADGKGGHASLVTANGNSGAETAGREISKLANLTPDVTQSQVALTSFTLTQTPAVSTAAYSYGTELTYLAIAVGTGTTPPTAADITFHDGQNTLPCNPPTPPVEDTATAKTTVTCKIATLAVATHTISAQFAADGNYLAHAAVTLTQQIGPDTPTVTVTATPGSSTVNESVTLRATVANSNVNNPGVTPPRGNVTFKATSAAGEVTPIGTAVIGNAGSASVVIDSMAPGASAVSLAPGAYSIQATYAGAAPDYGPATGSALLGVSKGTADVALSSNFPNGPTASLPDVNTPVIFTAKVTASPLGKLAPGGTVSFTAVLAGQTTATVLACEAGSNTVIDSAGKATCKTTALLAGVNTSITATYSGDTNFNGAASDPTYQNVNKADPVVTITPPTLTGKPTVNQKLMFTASVTSSPTVKPAGGTVVFSTSVNGPNNPQTLCAVALSASGGANCTAALPLGQNSVTAIYSGDSNFNKFTSPTPSLQNVGKAATVVTFSSIPTASTVNDYVTITAQVVGNPSGAMLPTGTVTFSTALSPATVGTPICSNVPLDKKSGLATCHTPMLLAGSNAITATYTGDTNFTGGTGGSKTIDVAKAASIVTLTSTRSGGSTVNQPVEFDVTVSGHPAGGIVPNGTVKITAANGSTVTTICTVASLPATGKISCTTSTLALGSNVMAAVYSGDSNFSGNSGPLTQKVSAAATTTDLAYAGPNTGKSTVNQSVSFIATVTPVLPVPKGGTSPSGKVVFSEVGSSGALVGIPECSGKNAVSLPRNSDKATCTTTSLVADTYQVTAVFEAGDENFSGSTSKALPQIVSPTHTKLSLLSLSPTSVATQTVMFKATLTLDESAHTIPTSGQLTFSVTGGGNNPFELCSPSAVSVDTKNTSSYTTTCSITFPAGSNSPFTVTAKYADDPNFQPSTTTASQTVQDFTITQSPNSTTPIMVTQTYAVGGPNVKSPDVIFNRVITATTSPISSYSRTITYSCTIESAGGATTALPNCYLGDQPSTASIVALGVGTLPVSVATLPEGSPKLTPPGNYIVTLIASDQAAPKGVPPLTHKVTYKVTVAPLTSQLTLASGGATTTADVVFQVAVPGDTYTFKCLDIVDASTGSSSSNVICKPPSSGALSSGSASFAISTPASQVANEVPPPPLSGGISAAALIGFPLAGLISLLGYRKLHPKSLFRLMGLMLVTVGLTLQTVGCGGGFTPPPVNPAANPVSYLIEVQAVDMTSGRTYFAVIPVTVNQ